MKKILPYLLVVLIMPTLIFSCKKDENDAPQVGTEKWFFEKVVSEEYDPFGVLIDSETDTNWTADDYLSLQTDGKYSLVQSGDKVEGTYTIDNYNTDKSFLTLRYLDTSNLYTTINFTILEKSASRFTLYLEDSNGPAIFQTTIYLKR